MRRISIGNGSPNASRFAGFAPPDASVQNPVTKRFSANIDSQHLNRCWRSDKDSFFRHPKPHDNLNHPQRGAVNTD